MIEKLLPYIPIAAKKSLSELLNNYRFHLKITKGRKTKRGDFRATLPIATISINNDLSEAQFLITLVHEIAHLETHMNYPKAKPHGKQWKQNFQRLMLPFLTNDIFEDEILSPLAKHLVNPKATTDSDLILSTQLQLKVNCLDLNKKFIFELKSGDLFLINNRVFKILNKRRTRYECLETKNQKKFLIKGNALITRIEPKKNTHGDD